MRKKNPTKLKNTADKFFKDGAMVHAEREFPKDFDFELEEVAYNNGMKGDFSHVINKEYAYELKNSNILKDIHIVSVNFGGEDTDDNKLIVTKKAYDEKLELDKELEKLMKEGKEVALTYEADYIGESVIPLNIKFIVSGDVDFTKKVEVWKK